MKSPDFSIVLPAFNESKNLPRVVKNLKLTLDNAKIYSEIIVVNNGSTDNTQEVLKELKREIEDLGIVKIEKNIGFGNGVLKGLEVARSQVLGYMNADGQVDPKDVVRAFFKLKNEHLDLCKGIRVRRPEGLFRKGISKVYNFLFRLMFQCPFEDINCSPKIFTRSFFEKIRPTSRDWFIDPEILIKACKNKLSVGEIPVVSLERKRGSSKVSVILTSFEFIKNMICWFLFKRL